MISLNRLQLKHKDRHTSVSCRESIERFLRQNLHVLTVEAEDGREKSSRQLQWYCHVPHHNRSLTSVTFYELCDRYVSQKETSGLGLNVLLVTGLVTITFALLVLLNAPLWLSVRKFKTETELGHTNSLHFRDFALALVR